MKTIAIFATLIAISLARPQGDAGAVITRYESENAGLGNYNYAYETSNGIAHQEQGQLKNAGTENEALAVTGQYTWIAPDGQQYSIQYVADENGFRPQGAHIPRK